jgi:hypothetical protein
MFNLISSSIYAAKSRPVCLNTQGFESFLDLPHRRSLFTGSHESYFVYATALEWSYGFHHERIVAIGRRQFSQIFFEQKQNPSMNVSDSREQSGSCADLVVFNSDLYRLDCVCQKVHLKRKCL